MRVLSLCPAATELVCSLGASHLLVGRTDDCDFPDSARSVPSIGNAQEITLDSIAIFEPDLVFIGPGQSFSPPAEARWSVVRVEPESLDDVYSLVVGIGAALGKQVEADMLVHDLRSALDKLHAACTRFRATRVYCERMGGAQRPAPPRTHGIPTYLRELIAIAGGDAYHGADSLEPLLAFDPQMIFMLAPCEDEHFVEIMVSRDGWSAMQAVKTERLFVMDERIFRPTPRLTEGAKMLAKILHGVIVNGS